MPTREIPLYTLRSVFKPDFAHQVKFWDGYGAVAPMLWTTNGSIRYTARLTVDHVRAGNYLVEDTDLPLEVFSEARLLEADLMRRWIPLRDAYTNAWVNRQAGALIARGRS